MKTWLISKCSNNSNNIYDNMRICCCCRHIGNPDGLPTQCGAGLEAAHRTASSPPWPSFHADFSFAWGLSLTWDFLSD
jgi:hypothetical protein